MTEQIQEVPQPTQPVQSVPVESKKKSNLKIIALLLLVILLLAGAVYAGMQLEKNKIKVWTEPPLTEITPQPTEVIDETASWKTYTSKLNYSFKYPEKINIQTTDSGLGKNFLEVVYLNNPSKEEPYSQVAQVNVFDNPKNLSLPDFEKEHTYGFYSDKAKSITISGKNGYLLEKIGCDPFLCQEGIVVALNKRVYLFHYFWEEDKALFDQILSTFKFLGTQNMTDSLMVANKYLTAYVSKDWDTVRNMLGCKTSDTECFVQNAAESYGFVKYEILEKDSMSNEEYNYFDIRFYDKNGTKYEDAPHNQGNLKLMLIKDPSGNWRPMTWYFYE